MKVLAFDIGIKNLAFSIVTKDLDVGSKGDTVCTVLKNINLVKPVEQIKCSKCKLNASFTVTNQTYCKRHIPKTHTVLPELSAKPSNKLLNELVKTHNCATVGKTSEKCFAALSTKFALPYKQAKQENAAKITLEQIHDALREFVKDSWSDFNGCTSVLLENQPAFKNPHMKSVQVLLFASLREVFLQHDQRPSYHFIHAKKKVTDAEAGDEGYKERKNKSELRAVAMFTDGTVKGDAVYQHYTAAKKKSDMADALCMCIDFITANM